jgi:hypothetical protein
MSLGLVPDVDSSVTTYTHWFCNPICRLSPVFQPWIPTRKSSNGVLSPRLRLQWHCVDVGFALPAAQGRHSRQIAVDAHFMCLARNASTFSGYLPNQL